MPSEIYMTSKEGNTLYALIWRKSDDKVWNDLSNVFETYTDVDIDEYDVPLTNQADSDYHSADFPVAITDEGVYRVQILLQPGAIDADADFGIGQGEISWDGTAEIDMFTLDELINVALDAATRQVNVYGDNE